MSSEDAPVSTTDVAPEVSGDAPLEGAAAAEREARLRCRFYEQEFPDMDQLVVVNVRNIAEMGVYVTLLEYDNAEGMILLSELSRRRIRSIPKLIRVGKNEIVTVLRVDREKGYIDLSKRRVSPEDVAAAEEKFIKSKAVHSILTQVAIRCDAVLKSLYERIGWPLYRRFGHALDGFRLAVGEFDKVMEGLEMSSDEREALQYWVNRRLTPQAVKVRADIEVTCFQYEGIDAIKEALLAGKAKGTEELPISIRLIAPPLFVVTTQALDVEAGIAVLSDAITEVKEKVEAKGGTLNVKMAPRATSQRDDHELSMRMEQLEKENREVDGDTAVDE